jgi:hypothetical protein
MMMMMMMVIVMMVMVLVSLRCDNDDLINPLSCLFVFNSGIF